MKQNVSALWENRQFPGNEHTENPPHPRLFSVTEGRVNTDEQLEERSGVGGKARRSEHYCIKRVNTFSKFALSSAFCPDGIKYNKYIPACRALRGSLVRAAV